MATKTKLTKRSVEAVATPADGIVDAWDTEIAGFHIRVWPSGKRSYRVKYRAAGRQRIVTIGAHGDWTAEQARKCAVAIRHEVSSGGDPLASKQDAVRAAEETHRRSQTMSELVERWLGPEGRAAAPDKREISWITDESRLRRHVLPLIGAMALGDVTRSVVENVQQRITNGETAADEKTGKHGRAIVTGGPMVARAAVVTLSSCFSWAVARGLMDANPCVGVRKEKPRKRERFLTQAEALRLLDVLNEMEDARETPSAFADAIRVLMLTGARKSEILALRWSEVDLERGFIVLPRERSKTGEKVIALSAPAMAIIAGRDRAGAFVFPSERNPGGPIVGLQKHWDRIRARAGLYDVRVHDLRHSFASFAAADGASLPMIAKALGHTQITTAHRYAHFGVDPVKELAERVGQKLMLNRRASENHDKPG